LERTIELKKYLFLLSIILLVSLVPVGGCTTEDDSSVGMAVEFMDHAACAYISRDKGWFEEEGLKLNAYESYVTGMALSSALTRGDIQVAYLCLIPAINAYANAGVPIKVVAGTHKYGYGLVVNPEKITAVKDLEKTGIRLGCVREGGAVDVLLQKTIDTYKLDEDKVVSNIQRINPAKIVLAIKMGQLDAAFLPEQWATMAEEFDFKMLLMSQDIWPEMQGSVLVVTEDLINNHPATVEKLIKVTRKAMEWGDLNPDEAAEIMARQLSAIDVNVFPAEAADITSDLAITPEVLRRSMERLDYTIHIDPDVVQDTIDYITGLGYIKSSFDSGDILDLRFIKQ
jgi:NitT/TauT family transport system substrate-binding protein